MSEEKFYCPECTGHVEYVPDLESYTCGSCEVVFSSDDVLRGTGLLEAIATELERPIVVRLKQPPMGEFL